MAWRDFCDKHRIDRTVFAEVVGEWMVNAPDDLPELVASWVREAVELKNERRRRG